MRRLTLVYDAMDLAPSTRRWIESQRKYLPIDCVPCRAIDDSTVDPKLGPLQGHITLFDEEGNLWRDGGAELMVLWAMRRYRARALRIGHPSRLAFRRSNLNWIAGGSGVAWSERSEHGGGTCG